MRKIRTTLTNVRDEIKEFYDERVWHFITLNALSLDEKTIEVQWMFSKYESIGEIIIFYVEIELKEIIPSIVDIIPSSIISQRELVDMFGVEVEGSPKGLYLDADSEQMPLSGCSI